MRRRSISTVIVPFRVSLRRLGPAPAHGATELNGAPRPVQLSGNPVAVPARVGIDPLPAFAQAAAVFGSRSFPPGHGVLFWRVLSEGLFRRDLGEHIDDLLVVYRPHRALQVVSQRPAQRPLHPLSLQAAHLGRWTSVAAPGTAKGSGWRTFGDSPRASTRKPRTTACRATSAQLACGAPSPAQREQSTRPSYGLRCCRYLPRPWDRGRPEPRSSGGREIRSGPARGLSGDRELDCAGSCSEHAERGRPSRRHPTEAAQFFHPALALLRVGVETLVPVGRGCRIGRNPPLRGHSVEPSDNGLPKGGPPEAPPAPASVSTFGPAATQAAGQNPGEFADGGLGDPELSRQWADRHPPGQALPQSLGGLIREVGLDPAEVPQRCGALGHSPEPVRFPSPRQASPGQPSGRPPLRPRGPPLSTGFALYDGLPRAPGVVGWSSLGRQGPSG